MVMFDTNYVLRLILDDNKEMADTAENAIRNDIVYVRDEVIAEAVHVLAKVYGQERQVIAKAVSAFINLKNITLDSKAVTVKGLQYYAETSLTMLIVCLLHFIPRKAKPY